MWLIKLIPSGLLSFISVARRVPMIGILGGLAVWFTLTRPAGTPWRPHDRVQLLPVLKDSRRNVTHFGCGHTGL